jgi:hypothetical protein
VCQQIIQLDRNRQAALKGFVKLEPELAADEVQRDNDEWVDQGLQPDGPLTIKVKMSRDGETDLIIGENTQMNTGPDVNNFPGEDTRMDIEADDCAPQAQGGFVAKMEDAAVGKLQDTAMNEEPLSPNPESYPNGHEDAPEPVSTVKKEDVLSPGGQKLEDDP